MKMEYMGVFSYFYNTLTRLEIRQNSSDGRQNLFLKGKLANLPMRFKNKF